MAFGVDGDGWIWWDVEMDWKETVTFGLAVVGALLGVLNTWRSLIKDRVRLRLNVAGYITNQGDRGINIEVVNLSEFAITVKQVAFDHRNGNILVVLPIEAYGGKIPPQRLEPRASFSAVLPASRIKDADFAGVTRAFAITACGRKFRGSSVYLKSLIKKARASAKDAA